MSDFLRKLNSATQYPSIPTYHKLGERGRLTEEVQVEFDGDVVVTEKIDGTNARIILPPLFTKLDIPMSPPFYIGSRSELLTAGGDVIYNPAQRIVQTLYEEQGGDEDFAAAVDSIALDIEEGAEPDLWTVVFGEVYGSSIGKAGKQYAADAHGFRVFDVMEFESSILERTIESIAAERDGKLDNRAPFQHWAMTDDPWALPFELVPVMEAEAPPASVRETVEWLSTVVPDRSLATLDEGAKGGIEGVIVRSRDRSRIAKIRFEDYARTLKAAKR